MQPATRRRRRHRRRGNHAMGFGALFPQWVPRREARHAKGLDLLVRGAKACLIPIKVAQTR